MAITINGTGTIGGLGAGGLTGTDIRFSSTQQGIVASSGGGTTKFLRADGTWIEPAPLRLTFAGSGTLTWTNMPAAVTFFNGDNGTIQKADLTNFSECRLLVNKTATAGAAGSILELEYSTTFTQTASSYSTIGSTAVSVAVDVQNSYLDTGWISLVSGAKAHVFLAVTGTGGNGTLDPTFGQILAEFR